MLLRTNQDAEAEALLRRMIAIREKSLGPGHPEVIKGLERLRLVLANTKQIGEWHEIDARLQLLRESP